MLRGELDVALTQADVVHWAYHGASVFENEPRHDQLRFIADLYPESLHLVALIASGIDSVADLRDKGVSMDEAGSGTLHDAKLILDYYSITMNDIKDIKPVYLKPNFSARVIAESTLDAFFIFAGYPVSAVADLAGTSDAKLIPNDTKMVDVILAEHPHFKRGVIPKGIYGSSVIPANTYKNSGDTLMLTVGAQVLANANLDEELVYQFTRAVASNYISPLRTGHIKGATISRGNAPRGRSIPLHPGAECSCREQGLLKAEPQNHGSRQSYGHLVFAICRRSWW